MQLEPRRVSYRPARSATARSVIGGRVRWGSLSRRGRGALPAGSGGRVKAIMGLESARNGDAHASRFGRLVAVPASVWPCKPSSRLNRAPLFCALVIRSTLFAKLSAIRLFRSTHVFKSGGTSGGRRRTRLALAPPQAPRRCHKGRIRSQSQERHCVCPAPSQRAFSQWMQRSTVPFPSGV